MDLKGKTIYVISALKFLNLIETRHDSKRLENNSKLLMKYIDIFKFYKQLLYFYLKNRNSFNLDSKAVKQSVASIIFKYIREQKHRENSKFIYSISSKLLPYIGKHRLLV